MNNSTLIIKKHTASDVFYYTGLIIWVTTSVFESSIIKGPFTELRQIGFALALFSVLLDADNFNLHVADLFPFISLLLLSWHGGDLYIVQTIIFAYGFNNRNVRVVLRTILYIESFVCAFIVMLSLVGIYSNSISPITFHVTSNLGFKHPATLIHYLLNLVLIYCYLVDFKINIQSSIIIILITLLSFMVSDVLIALLPLLIFIIIPIYRSIQNGISNRTVLVFLFRHSFTVISIASVLVFLVLNPTSGIGRFLDVVLSHRISLSRVALLNYGISLFGSDISFVYASGASQSASGYFFLDNSFIQILFVDGIIALLFVLIIFRQFMGRLVSANNYKLIFIMLLFGFNSFIDPQLMYLQYCSFLLFLWVRDFNS